MEKIAKGKDIRHCEAFKGYTGDPCKADVVLEYIIEQFRKRIPEDSRRLLYTKKTTATDPELMGEVLQIINHAVLRKNLHAVISGEW